VLRLIGDPEQHSAVAAGGYFRYLVERHPEEVPVLTANLRQHGEQMAGVRLALTEYREGRVTEALQQLADDGHIREAGSAGEAIELLACAWYAEHQARQGDPSRPPSSMIAEHHHERLALNAAARALLRADGTLSGPELEVAGVGFQVNDEVIARLGDHDLYSSEAGPKNWVRNGSRGIVTGVGGDHLEVSFERWGSVRVPRSFLEREVVPGVRGGLAHSYALTTFAAQGQTMAAAMPLVTDASSREGTYVALSRPRLSLQAVAIRYEHLRQRSTDDALPEVREERSDLEAAARALSADRRERLATDADARARRAAELATTMDLHDLAAAHGDDHLDHALLERAYGERLRRVALRAAADPDPEVLAHLGPRPAAGAERRAWDQAVGGIAAFREHQRVRPAENGTGIEWALGPRPEDPEAAAAYERIGALITPILIADRVPPASAPSEEPSPARPYGGLDDEALERRARRLAVELESHLADLAHLRRQVQLRAGARQEGTGAERDARRTRRDQRIANFTARRDDAARRLQQARHEQDRRASERLNGAVLRTGDPVQRIAASDAVRAARPAVEAELDEASRRDPEAEAELGAEQGHGHTAPGQEHDADVEDLGEREHAWIVYESFTPHEGAQIDL
jgi:hypothetical protein